MFKLQPREQSIIGIAAIIGVIILGFFGIGSFGVSPQWDNFSKVNDKLKTANNTVQTNEATLANLNQQKTQLSGSQATLPKGKIIESVDYQKGKTLEGVKTELLNIVIEMSQKEDGNTLIYVKPLPKPAPPPAPLPTTPPDPNAPPAPPTIQLSDFIEEVPYEIAIRGNYSTINKFVNDLAVYNTVVEITRLEVIPENQAGGNFKDPTKPLKAIFTLNYIIKKG